MSSRFFLSVLVASALLTRASAGQERADSSLTHDPVTGVITFTTVASARDSILQLPHEFILESSERVLVNSRHLSRSGDYSIHYRSGRIVFHNGILSDSLVQLTVSYRLLPLPPRKSYFKHELLVRRDTLGSVATVVSAPTRFTPDNLFGAGLQKSGSIFRGLTVASNSDLSLSSGFRMQLSGKLSDEVDVVAALTDENSPIQPEGTTQTLQEVDKVFIELTHPSYGATLGDFTIEPSSSQRLEFGNFSRKVQGARGVARLRGEDGFVQRSTFSLTAASARGKYHTNLFQGIEGSQGPYRLTGKNGERRIIVVAGTERVYLNGEVMTRGEKNDYVIDYASAEVHFTPKRLITNASRISIDFEYTDRQYGRNIVVGSTDAQLMGKRLNLSALVLQEADDPDAPIDFELNDQSRALLQASGADRFKAVLGGIRFVGRDESGPKGQYMLRDTVIVGRRYSILVYAPGDSLALYSATFSLVEKMPADSAGYERVAVGHFRFAGIGSGNYLPVQFLPMPQRHQFTDIRANASITDNVEIITEYAASNLDRNRFSVLDNVGSTGSALMINTRYSDKEISIGGEKLGALELSIRKRIVDRRFAAPDRFNEVEFARKWDVDLSNRSDEDLQEAQFSYKPSEGILLSGSYGSFEQKSLSKSTRTGALVEAREGGYPDITYALEKIQSNNRLANTQSSWLRHRGDMHYGRWVLRPGIRIEYEDRNQVMTGTDSSQAGSFRFVEYAPRVEMLPWGVFSANAEWQFRREDSALAGKRQRAFHATTQRYSFQFKEWNAISSSLDLSIRKGIFTEAFRLRGNSNSEVILVRSLSRYSPVQRQVEAEAFYEFSSQRSARQERVFLRVRRGSGNYRYRGDLNGNNTPDEDEFEPVRFDGDYVVIYVPSERLYPIVDLKAATRLRLNGDRLIGERNTFVANLLGSLSTETYLRVDERSSDPQTRHIYLLQLETFQNPATTIAGSNQIQQDLYIFERRPDLSFRFRYNQRKGLTQFIATTERSRLLEQSVRIRTQLLPEIGNVTEYMRRFDEVRASTPTSRERSLDSHILSSDFSYRPMPRWEVGFRFDVTRTLDRFNNGRAAADINEQSVRVVYALVGAGQFRSEFEREEVVVSNIPAGRVLPYEFTSGRVVGKTFLWQFAFEYRIAQNIQVTINYNGRSEGNRLPVHTARAEARAFF